MLKFKCFLILLILSEISNISVGLGYAYCYSFKVLSHNYLTPKAGPERQKKHIVSKQENILRCFSSMMYKMQISSIKARLLGGEVCIAVTLRNIPAGTLVPGRFTLAEMAKG